MGRAGVGVCVAGVASLEPCWSERWTQGTELESCLGGCLGSNPDLSLSGPQFPHVFNGVAGMECSGFMNDGLMCSEIEKGSHTTEPGGQRSSACG